MTVKGVLVHPYCSSKDPVAKLFNPLGIDYLASQLKKREIELEMVDCTFLEVEEALTCVISHRPYIIGISMLVTLTAADFAMTAPMITGWPARI
jgi:hypothetical protein